jgi:hypothetical protein
MRPIGAASGVPLRAAIWACWRATASCAVVAAGAVLLLLAGCGERAAQPSAGAPNDRGNAIDAIVAKCADDMVAAPDDTVVFVAGVGAIDAQVYNRLLADGQAMCETVRKSCVEAWDGPACKTARALYPSL